VKTFLRLLGVAFWMLPVQRVLTALGAGTILVVLAANIGTGRDYNLPGTPVSLVFAGAALMLFAPLAFGGALFRIVSAPRAIQLLPHARGRLLGGMIGVVMLGTLLWIVAYWAAFRRAPAQYRPDAAGFLMMYVLTLSFATQASIGIFVASRGPLAALIVIGAWQLSGIVLRLAGVADVPRLLTGTAGLLMVPLAWLVFGAWYLRAARIPPPWWGRMRTGASAVAPIDTGNLPTREQAMARWVLGGSTPLRITLLWLAGVAVLVGVQLLLPVLLGFDSPRRAVAATIFSTMAMSFVASGSIGWSIAMRSRGLWLTGGRNRRELHAWCERVMVRVLVLTGMPFLVLGTALWWVLPERPALPGTYMLLALLAPALAAAWIGLMQVRSRVVVELICALAIIVGMWLAIVQPQIIGAGPRWGVLGAQFALVFVVRQLAAWRWRGVDWPRAQRIQPAS
jgi:hypothetical protein